MSHNLNKIWLVGAGPMAQEYAKVLLSMNVPFDTIGRSEKSASEFYGKTSCKAVTGGLENHLINSGYVPETAIVAVCVTQLYECARLLLESGVKNILAEKPAGRNSAEIKKLADLAKEKGANVFVAYNRRFYSSVSKAAEIIKEDGGVKSFNFEFTEWGHVIGKSGNPKEVLDVWFLANSTHIIDLAFYLGGAPQKLSSYSGGGLDWHKSGSIYAGAGISKTGALFSYQANWGAPGRWSVEMLTSKHRLIFRPVEELQIQNIGSVQIEKVEIEDKLDKDFKPGLYAQIKAFLENREDKRLIDIFGHYENSLIYEQIENGIK